MAYDTEDPAETHTGRREEADAARRDEAGTERPAGARSEYPADARSDYPAESRADYPAEPRVAHEGLVTSVPAQREAYGGMHFGAAFFGWLAAMGMAFVLTAILAAAGTAVGVATGTTPSEAASKGADNVQTIGWAGSVVLAVLVFVSYFAGGYTAARMARFSGAKQGLGVWLWALLAAIVVAVVVAIAGTKYNVLSQLNGFPRIPVKEGDLTTVGVVALVVVAVASLVGALLGGSAGTLYHRRGDRAGAVDEAVALERA